MTTSSDLASLKAEMEDAGVTTVNAIVVAILEHVGFYEVV